ncbi:hypothetical protein N656DRAFT_783925 [Canariomyces notabilis]|uniref:Uncharacterized protein n=1 Tax=Canariomyces notabilis TaxID=2074819 RepID=A0AAN6QEG6_9PEZI|nr:hypothetical protein N656DRAFT_783925 [Canariomyces arenarius]
MGRDTEALREFAAKDIEASSSEAESLGYGYRRLIGYRLPQGVYPVWSGQHFG